VSAGNDIVISPSIVLTTSSITGHVVSISYNIPVATVVATSTVYAVTISFGAGVIATTIPATSQFGITTVHASSSVIAQTVLSIASVSEATTSASSRATPNVILVLTAIPVPYVESGSILTLTDDGSVGVVETVDILVLIQVVDSGSLSVSDLALVYPIAAGAVVTTNADDLVLITESNNDLDIYASSTGGENVILHSQAVGTVISSESSTTVFETDS
jgi:hypothetical protein